MLQYRIQIIWYGTLESKNTSSVWSQFHSAHAHGLPLSLICILLFIVALLYFALDLFSIVLRYITLLYSALDSIVHLYISLLYTGSWSVPLFIVALLCCILLRICFLLLFVTLLFCILVPDLYFIVHLYMSLLFSGFWSVPYCSSLDHCILSPGVPLLLSCIWLFIAVLLPCIHVSSLRVVV